MRTEEYKIVSKDVPTPINSRYYRDKYINDAGLVFKETYTPVVIPLKDTDKYTQIGASEVGRADMLALRMYKDPKLYWFILMANDIINPITELTEGRVMRIPNVSGVILNAI